MLLRSRIWPGGLNKTALRRYGLSAVRDVQRDPFPGLGKPELLKHELSGCWSRRINQEHRMVYQVLPEKIRILACRFHY